MTALLQMLESSDDPTVFDRNPAQGEPGWMAFHAGHLSAPRGVLAQNPFDERLETARFTDLELGYRLARTGHRIELDPGLVVWSDEPATLATVRERYGHYGADAARLHELHSEARLAEGLGIAAARSAQRTLTGLEAVALETIEGLEALLSGTDLRSQGARRTLGVAGAERILAECYASVVRGAFVDGVRGHLELPRLAEAPTDDA